ncbi:MAG TPA: methyltransferase domain-containing protein [Candidatus Binatia bacterium]
MTTTTPMDRVARGDDGGARDFFEGYARDFDHIYDEGGKGALARYVDTSLRKEMRIRFEKTFEALAPLKGRSLFDAGCGGGRYAIPAAKAGASEVLGIDFSETMLALGRQKAAEEGVANVCRFEVGDLLTYPVREKSFDYAIAIGFFDYQKDPEAALKALARAAKRRVFVSLPKRWHVLTPQRWVRYTFFKCYIRFYSRADVEKLAATVNPKKVTIFDIGREFNLRIDFE